MLSAGKATRRQVLDAVRAQPAVVNARGIGGTTPLMEAAFYGRREVVQELLAAKAAVNLAAAKSKQTALDYAILGGHDEIAQLLRAAGGKEAPQP